jgi:hypothetical protein
LTKLGVAHVTYVWEHGEPILAALWLSLWLVKKRRAQIRNPAKIADSGLKITNPEMKAELESAGQDRHRLFTMGNHSSGRGRRPTQTTGAATMKGWCNNARPKDSH